MLSAELKKRKALVVLFSLTFAGLAVYHVQTKKLDAIALALVAVSLIPAILPFIRENIKSIELPLGIKVELLEMKVKRQEARLETQQEIINQLVVYSMAFYLYEMIADFYKCEQGILKEYVFRKTGNFEHHIRYLRDHGYLEMTFRVGALSDGENIAGKVKLTPVGRFYVELRSKYKETYLSNA
jgi:hypothetical protein